MTTAVATEDAGIEVRSLTPRRPTEISMSSWWPWVTLVVGVVVLQVLLAKSRPFPAVWDAAISDRLDDAGYWMQTNRRSGHWLFSAIFTPISDAVGWGLETIESLFLGIPWFVWPLLVFALCARNRSYKAATVAALAMVYPGLVGLWDVTIETLALMTMAVLVSVVVGVPLGIWAAFHRGFERFIRPILDAMQVVPAPVYFVPMLLLFGIGKVPAVMATVIYALPPIVRLTTLGIRQVPEASVQASTMFGATRAQTLRKVQLPLAMPTVLAGLTQTIMMALGIVVLATLLGAGGLGQSVMDTLNQRRTGRGIGVGLAIVAVAIVLDRVGRSFADRDPTKAFPARRQWMVAGGLVALIVIGRVAGWLEFPEVWSVNIFDPVDDGLKWIRDNWRWLTRGANDGIVTYLYIPVRNFLTEGVAWGVLIWITAWLGWRLRSLAFGLGSALSLAFVGLIGMWELTVDTFTQVMIGVGLAVLIAIPLGVWIGRSRRAEMVVSPLLDALQTIPSLVYIIPAVTLFTVGVVPGLIASILYAMVPGVRLTALGMKQVPAETVEASTMFGATPSQTLRKVRLPLAASTIMAGVNQVIMMTLAMVIISGLVGGGALGFETITAVKRSEVGLGFEVGLSIVVIAIILDRLTESIGQRFQPPAA